MEVYPNPTHGEFSLDLKLSRRQDVEVMVRDLLGRTIHDRTISGTTGDVLNLDLTGQPAGVYIVSVRTDAGVISRKIVMQ
jgi:hypothetical protein